MPPKSIPPPHGDRLLHSRPGIPRRGPQKGLLGGRVQAEMLICEPAAWPCCARARGHPTGSPPQLPHNGRSRSIRAPAELRKSQSAHPAISPPSWRFPWLERVREDSWLKNSRPAKSSRNLASTGWRTIRHTPTRNRRSRLSEAGGFRTVPFVKRAASSLLLRTEPIHEIDLLAGPDSVVTFGRRLRAQLPSSSERLRARS
jgi:hypothetical protein